jgi:hypothetical protein
MMGDPEARIGRPRQLYKGYRQRDYVSLGERAELSTDVTKHGSG